MLEDLNTRATLLARTLTPDGGGGFSESWAVTGSAWIAIEPLSAADKFGPDASETRIRHRILLRARGDVTAGMRLTAGTRRFAIRAVVKADGTDPLMKLMCEELP